MSESTELLLKSLGLLITIYAAVWVWQDSRKLKAAGVSLAPLLWVTLVVLLWLVSLPAYLLLRRWHWQKQIPEDRRESLRLRRRAADDLRSSEIENGETLCSEAAIRAIATDLRRLPRAEAWQRLHNHYYAHSCADFLDVDRFEEIVIEVLTQEQGDEERGSNRGK